MQNKLSDKDTIKILKDKLKMEKKYTRYMLLWTLVVTGTTIVILVKDYLL